MTASAAAWAGRSRDSRGAAVLLGFGLAGQSSAGGAHGADRCVRRGTVSHHGRAAAVRRRGIEGPRPPDCSLERLGRELGSQSSARCFGSCRGTSGRRMVEEPARWFGGCSPDRCSPVGGDRVFASVMATSRRHPFPRKSIPSRRGGVTGRGSVAVTRRRGCSRSGSSSGDPTRDAVGTTGHRWRGSTVEHAASAVCRVRGVDFTRSFRAESMQIASRWCL